MQFEFDRSKMFEVTKSGTVELDGEVFDNYTSGPWNFSMGNLADRSVRISEDTIYAFASWIEFMYKNELNLD
jgi:hypothetical protein